MRQVVILSYGLWQRRFGGDPGVLGKEVKLNDNSYTIIGVMPSTYHHPDWSGNSRQPELWTPADLPIYENDRRYDWLMVIARKHPHVSLEQAQAEMSVIGQRLAQQYPQTNTVYKVEVTSLKKALVGNFRKPLWLLLGAVGLLMLVACANIANLSLARSFQRTKEFSVRAALGASPIRMFRQLMIENLLLSLIGGVTGVIVAKLGLNFLISLDGVPIPPGTSVRLDGWVLLFTFVLSCITGLVFGSLPALQAYHADLHECLKVSDTRAGNDPRHRWTRTLLVSAEVGLTLVLLISSVLLLRSFWRVQSIEPGFEPNNIFTAEVELPIIKTSKDPRTSNFLIGFLERVRQIHGVEAVGAINGLPLNAKDQMTDREFRVEGRTLLNPFDVDRTTVNITTPDYFTAMGIPLRRGRFIQANDVRGSAPPVALINETLANRHFQTEDPIGRRLLLGEDRFQVQIIGVVADVKQNDLISALRPQVYLYVKHTKIWMRIHPDCGNG